MFSNLKKKGQVMQNLGALGIGIAMLVVLLAVTFLVMAQLKTNMQDSSDNQACGNTTLIYNSTNNFCCDTLNCTQAGTFNSSIPGGLSNAMNATQDLTAATATIPSWVSLIVLVVIGGIILSMVSLFKKR